MGEPDLAAVRRRLAARGVERVRPLVGGASSLTFGGQTADGPVVVKMAPPGHRPVGHRDVLRQAHILRALAPTEVPVPEVRWEDPGQPPEIPPLFVMSLVEGQSFEPLFDPPAGDADPALVGRYEAAAATMAALHRLSPASIGLAGEPVLDAAAEIQRWSATLETVDPALVGGWVQVRDRLSASVPEAMNPSVVHGDFRLGNLLADGTRITAVIDWEIWSLGDPRIDAGWFLINADPNTYRRPTPYAGIVPPVSALAQSYVAALGTDVTDLAWFMALGCFKSAATWSLIVKHNRRRTAPDPDLEAMAPVLPRLLERADTLLG